MNLDTKNVAAYLVERGVLSADSDVLVKDVSRRNKNFRLLAGDAGFMIKQTLAASRSDILMLRREAYCYDMARSDAILSRLMPALVMYDSSANILVTRLARDAESVADRHMRGVGIPPELGEILGEAVARYQALPVSAFERMEARTPFPRRTPYILDAGEAALREWVHIGPLASQFSEVMRNQPELGRLLDKFRMEWRQDCLIHGDVSWENVLVFMKPAQQSDVLIVDWEMADVGDPAWDAGAILRSFLSAWLLANRESFVCRNIQAGSGPPPIETMRALTLAFWTAYARARRFDAATSRLELERSMQFASLQMAHVALEIGRSGHLKPEISSSTLEVVGVAFKLFQNPQPPVRFLLGG